MATTKHILLVGSMNDEMASKLALEASSFYFDANGLEKQQNISIHISSCGGNVEAEKAMLHIINSQPERFTIVANGEISSAAFGLFYRCNCAKTILPGTIGMYHLARTSIEISLNGKGFFDADKFHLKNFRKGFKEELVWCESLGISARDIELIAKGHDVYFTTEQLQEFLNNQKIERFNTEAAGGATESGGVDCVAREPEPKQDNNIECLRDDNEPNADA